MTDPTEVEEVALGGRGGPSAARHETRPSRDRVPAAVLWDMDGTLVDTEPYWMAVEHEIAAEAGGTWTHEDAQRLVGNPLLESGAYLRERLGLAETPEEVVERLLDGVVARVTEAVPWCDGARELLLALHEAGVPCGLVTSSYQRFVAPIVRHLPPETFSVVVTGDTVGNGKPHPEPYLTAAAALGVAIEECVAIEDSGAGATSAEAAGCTVLVVPNHVEVPPGPRRIFRESLLGLTPDALTALG